MVASRPRLPWHPLAWLGWLTWLTAAVIATTLGARRDGREVQGKRALAWLKSLTVYRFAAHLLVAAWVTLRSPASSPRRSSGSPWCSRSPTRWPSILFWACVLRKKRSDKGRPLPEAVAQNLMRIAYRIDRAWSVELRYFGFEVTVDSAKRSFEDVGWIKKNHAALWR